MKNVRESNLDLLKIISILLIIMFHYAFKSGYDFTNFNINAYVIKVMYYFGELGVNLFVLISGYFMCKKKFSFKKLILLILEVQFYYWLTAIFLINRGVTNI